MEAGSVPSATAGWRSKEKTWATLKGVPLYWKGFGIQLLLCCLHTHAVYYCLKSSCCWVQQSVCSEPLRSCTLILLVNAGLPVLDTCPHSVGLQSNRFRWGLAANPVHHFATKWVPLHGGESSSGNRCAHSLENQASSIQLWNGGLKGKALSKSFTQKISYKI